MELLSSILKPVGQVLRFLHEVSPKEETAGSQRTQRQAMIVTSIMN